MRDGQWIMIPRHILLPSEIGAEVARPLSRLRGTTTHDTTFQVHASDERQNTHNSPVVTVTRHVPLFLCANYGQQYFDSKFARS